MHALRRRGGNEARITSITGVENRKGIELARALQELQVLQENSARNNLGW
jgi:hypothetical protein